MRSNRPIEILRKISELNPHLGEIQWNAVTADIVSNHLVLGSMTRQGLDLLNSLQNIKLEPTSATPVTDAKRPDNLYWIDIVYPPEVELRVPFLMKLLQTFPSGIKLSNPGKRPLGSHRRTRLHFNSVVAPRWVFTPDDPTIPIREISLSCGSTAIIHHKWPRLNTFLPTSIMNRAAPPTARQSYAQATSGTPQGNPHITTRPNIHHLPRRPGIIPTGPPPPTERYLTPTEPVHNTRPPRQTQNPTQDTNRNPQIANPDSDTEMPTRLESEIGQRDETAQDCRAKPTSNMAANPTGNHAQSKTTHHPGIPQGDENPNETNTDKDGWDLAQHRPIRRQQRRKTGPALTIHTHNKFNTLTYEEAEQLPDTDFTPLDIPQMRTGQRTTRRTTRTTSTIRQALAAEMNSSQPIRHPSMATRHTTPEFNQYLLGSKDEQLHAMQTTIIHQTTLVRTARENVGPDLNTLDDTDDSHFLRSVQARISRTTIAPAIHDTTPLATPINALHNSNRQNIERKIAFAWIDNATRAYMPLLYTLWPDEPTITDHKLRWLPSADNTFPCLTEESLSTIVHMPIAQPMWMHAAQHSAEVKQSLDVIKALPHTLPGQPPQPNLRTE